MALIPNDPVSPPAHVFMQNGIFGHKNQIMQLRPDYDSSPYDHVRVKRTADRTNNTSRRSLPQHRSSNGQASRFRSSYIAANLPLIFGDDAQPLAHPPHCKYIGKNADDDDRDDDDLDDGGGGGDDAEKEENSAEE